MDYEKVFYLFFKELCSIYFVCTVFVCFFLQCWDVFSFDHLTGCFPGKRFWFVLDMRNFNEDRKRLDSQRSAAARFFAERYDREMRYLLIFSRDFAQYLSSSEYLLKKDTSNQFYFDFLLDFESLQMKMKEFRWSKEFLKLHGIDYGSIRKLYFAVA